MARPIFDAPPPQLDETWPHGALLGGMCGFSEWELADAYFTAADLLARQRLHDDPLGHAAINPILFLYRHAIELYLKAVVQPSHRDHNLGALLEAFCRHVRARYGETVPHWLTKPISEFVQFDPTSTTFRYEDAPSDLRACGEYWVDLTRLRETMMKVRYAMCRVLRADATGEIPPPGCY